jgi:hypothetical protein
MVSVHRRLKLRAPQSDGAGRWTMRGRLRRLTSLHWVAVRVELWPRHQSFIMLTLTPERPVLASKRYFTAGHRVLDRFCTELVSAAESTKCGEPGA